jgi:hypothetical protein
VAHVGDSWTGTRVIRLSRSVFCLVEDNRVLLCPTGRTPGADLAEVFDRLSTLLARATVPAYVLLAGSVVPVGPLPIPGGEEVGPADAFGPAPSETAAGTYPQPARQAFR